MQCCDLSVDKAPYESLLAVLTWLKFPDKLENHFIRRIEITKYKKKKEGKNTTRMYDLYCASLKGVYFFIILRDKGRYLLGTITVIFVIHIF